MATSLGSWSALAGWPPRGWRGVPLKGGGKVPARRQWWCRRDSMRLWLKTLEFWKERSTNTYDKSLKHDIVLLFLKGKYRQWVLCFYSRNTFFGVFWEGRSAAAYQARHFRGTLKDIHHSSVSLRTGHLKLIKHATKLIASQELGSPMLQSVMCIV